MLSLSGALLLAEVLDMLCEGVVWRVYVKSAATRKHRGDPAGDGHELLIGRCRLDMLHEGRVRLRQGGKVQHKRRLVPEVLDVLKCVGYTINDGK
jgi:hypothetical protein